LGRFKFALTDNFGNLINEKYRTSKCIPACLTSHHFKEREVLKLIGKHLVESPVRKDPVTRQQKEKEGVFNFEEQMALIE